MNPALTVELQFFLISILCGAVLLLVYDIFRILRRVIKHNSFFIALEDLIFWVCASLFIFAMLFKENDGIIRGFAIIGMAIGMVLYHNILSDLIVNLITTLIHALISPFAFVLRKVKGFLAFVWRRMKGILKNITRRLKKWTKSVKITVNKRKQTTRVKRQKHKEAKQSAKQAREATDHSKQKVRLKKL